MNFEQALLSADKKLRKAKEKELLSDYIVIGAIALSRVAIVRSTGDIDFAVRLGGTPLRSLGEFLKGETREGDTYDPLLGCVSFQSGKGVLAVNIQLVQFPKGIEEAAFTGLESHVIKGTEIPFASWKGLLFLKLYAGSAVDLQDAANIVKHNPCSAIEFREIETIAAKLRLSKRLQRIR